MIFNVCIYYHRHFEELFRIFSTIKEHEKLSAQGLDPYQEKLKLLDGSYLEEADKSDNNIDDYTENEGIVEGKGQGKLADSKLLTNNCSSDNKIGVLS